MPRVHLDPKRTIVVILGASDFEKSGLPGGFAYYNSAWKFREYLIDPSGLGVDPRRLLWRFDSTDSPSEQLDQLTSFLSDVQNQHSSEYPLENLLLYYVGHGDFTRGDGKFFLAVRSTNRANPGPSAIRGIDLAGVLKEHAALLRRFLILDCCFSGSLLAELQSSPLRAAESQLMEELPRRGTSLLCSSSAGEFSRAPRNLEYTMFSDALIKALKHGDPRLGPHMSFGDLGAVIRVSLRREYSDDWIRPEVHSPDMREGDIAVLPLFPNPAWVDQERAAAEAKAQQNRLDQERAAAEAKDQQDRLDQERAAAEAKAQQDRLDQERAAAEAKAQQDRLDQERAAAEAKAQQDKREKARAAADAKAQQDRLDQARVAAAAKTRQDRMTQTPFELWHLKWIGLGLLAFLILTLLLFLWPGNPG